MYRLLQRPSEATLIRNRPEDVFKVDAEDSIGGNSLRYLNSTKPWTVSGKMSRI
jgi:hypothetical protein